MHNARVIYFYNEANAFGLYTNHKRKVMVIYDISFWEREAGEGVYGWREKSTLQSLRNVELSQQRFWHGRKNYLIKKAKKCPNFQVSN